MSSKVFRVGIKADYNKSNAFLRFMYKTPVGRALLYPLTMPWASKVAAVFLSSRLSKPMINRYIKKYDIDMTYAKKHKFSSFNDFFTRELYKEARPFCQDVSKLCAPCDGKLTVFKIDSDSVFEIKGTTYTLKELLHSGKLADRFCGGWCFVYRLEPCNYHRYAYIDDGAKSDNFYIKGVLHTVQPIAINRCKVFKNNCREFTLMKTKNFSEVVQIEVGALCVGKISNRHQRGVIHKGDEKGMFEFGGSTIIQLFRKDVISPDYDILINTERDCETPVLMGEAVGYKLPENK